MGKNKKATTKIYDFICEQDKFSHKVCFTHNGEDRYNTFIGGSSFLFIISLLLFYGIALFIKMSNRDEIVVNKSSRKFDASVREEVVKIKNGPKIAFFYATGPYNTANSNYTDIPIIATFGRRELSRSGLKLGYNDEGIEFQNCSEDIFPHQAAYGQFPGNIGFKCLDLSDLPIQGSILSKDYIFYQLNIFIDGHKIDYKNDSQWDYHFRGFYLKMFLLSDSVDMFNIQNPISKILEMEFFRLEDHTIWKQVDISIRKNNYQLDDGLFPWSPIQKEEFYTISETKETTFSRAINKGTDLLEINFILDYTEDYYERKVLKFLEVTGQLGGIFELYEIIGGFLIGWISSKMLSSEISQKLDRSEKIYQKNLEIYSKIQEKFNNGKLEEEKEKLQILSIEETKESKPIGLKRNKSSTQDSIRSYFLLIFRNFKGRE